MPTLIATTTALTIDDWRIPSTRMTVTTATMNTAGRLNIAPVAKKPFSSDQSIGALLSAAGIKFRPSSPRTFTRYRDQPTDTVEAANRYSSTRFQPMNQATPSPSVAYEYAYALPDTGIIEGNSA